MARLPHRSHSHGRKGEWVLMLVFGLGLLGVIMFNHSHLTAVPPLRSHRGHGHRYRLRTALELDAIEEDFAQLPGEESAQQRAAIGRPFAKPPLKRNAKWNTDTARHSTKLNVHLVCHTHHDPGWLKSYDQSFLGVRNDLHASVGPHISAVQYELDGIIHGLIANRDRRYVYGEMSFFKRWYDLQESETQERVRQLVKDGQLDFAGGGWVSNDEAICQYEDIIDQMTLGHRWLANTFGYVVRQHWQLDTFGHSGVTAALSALGGMDSMFFSRLDKEDIELRKPRKQLEFLWRGSPIYGPWGDIWTYAMETGSYYRPEGFALGQLSEFQAHGEHMVDDGNSTEPSNVAERVDQFVLAALRMAEHIEGNDIMFTMGGDFDWTNAFVWYRNLDKLIHHVNKDGRVNAMYSTPRLYTEAKKTYNHTWPVHVGDMFPYADCVQCYWTGYFTSRPSTKLLSRVASGYLRAARQLQLAAPQAAAGAPSLERLTQNVALLQHHDAITGTDRFVVNQDYRRLLALGMDDGQQVMNGALQDLLGLPAEGVSLQHCTLLNISVCAASVQSSAADAGFDLVLYNSLAWERTEPVRVPFSGGHTWTVSGPDGKAVATQKVPQSASTVRIVDSLTSRDAVFREQLKWVGDYDIAFSAKVPPMGYAAYRFQRTEGADAAQQPAQSVACMSDAVTAGGMKCSLQKHESRAAMAVGNGTDGVENAINTVTVVDSITTVISNGVLELTLERNASGAALTSLRDAATGVATRFSADMVYYEGSRHPRQPPWVVRPSGQYIFHPRGPAQPVRKLQDTLLVPVSAEVLVGPLVSEVRLNFTDEAQLTVRLWDRADWLEMEWTVGPLLKPHDVCLSVETDIQSGEEFFTDANSLAMVKRVRGVRAAFAAAPLEDNDTANPIGGNYFPVTSAIYVRDPAAGRQLSLVTDRGQGASSMRPGQLEVMLNRRTALSDELGNPERMDEQEGGLGVIARGTVRVSLQPAAAAAQHRRTHAYRTAWPLLPVFATSRPAPAQAAAPAPQPALQAPRQPQYSMLRTAKALPPPVHIMSLYQDDTTVIFRLAHIYEAGEHQQLAAPASVDIARLFAGLSITRLREVSLTGSHAVAQRSWPNRDFRAGRPMFTVDPALAAEAAQNASVTIRVADGFDQRGEWVGLTAGLASQTAGVGGGGGSGGAFQPSPPLEDWAAGSGGGGRAWLLGGPKLVVALQPSEIRTFELTLQRAGVESEQ